MVKEELFKLVTLHGIDRDIDDLRVQTVQQIKQLKMDQDRLATAQQQLDAKVEDLKRRKVESEQIESEIKGIEYRYKECSYQLLNLKDQKSYDAMKSQLQNLRESIIARESDGIEVLGHIESLDKTVEKYRGKIREEETRISEYRTQIEKQQVEYAPQLEELKKKRGDYARQIAAVVLTMYDRLLKLPDRRPMAELEGRNCSGCHSSVTLEAIEHLKMQQTLVTCNTCGRILYLPALLSKAAE